MGVRLYKYWQTVVTEATTEMLGIFGISRQRTLTAALILIFSEIVLVIGVHWYRQGWQEAYLETQMLTSMVYATLILGACILLIFLIVVPAKMSWEKDQKIESLRQEKGQSIAALNARLAPQFEIRSSSLRERPYFQVINRLEHDALLRLDQAYDIQVSRHSI